jgi:exodeoxyribonuclease VII small subunit
MKKKTTFNQKLERLEEISAMFDDDSMDIEETLQYYEEGILLAKECLDTLKAAELKIINLQKSLETENGGASDTIPSAND